MLDRRQFLSSLAAPVLAQQRQRPNLIVIWTDDQGIGDLGCYGASDVKTPNLDRLAASGVRFQDWHSSAPVCSPSRASLLTGQYPQRCGIPEILASKADFQVPGLRAGQRTLPGELRKLGYRTGAVGKWHLGSAPHSRPLAQGFESFYGFYSGWVDYYSHRYYTLGGDPVYHDLWRDSEEVFEDSSYQTEVLTREARAFLTKQSADQPFFLYLAYGAPHYPMMAPPKYLERFPLSMDRDRRMHAAMLAAIDDGVGQILDLLGARGLSNTAICFQSDNGATAEVRADHRGRPYRGGSNAPFRGYKGSLFEGGMRVPCLMRWPGHIAPGRALSGIGMAMDVLPTFVRWAGGTPPADVDGADLSPALLGNAPLPERTVFWDYAGQRAARAGKWKLIERPREALGHPAQPVEWLSNLEEDPRESRSYAAGQPDIVRDLKARAAQWAGSLGLPVP